MYDVALSFAGEDRPYVQQVAQRLVESGIKVFYDDFEKVDLWGKICTIISLMSMGREHDL